MADHIQIGDISPRIQFTGDGAQTLFTYPFPIFKDADLKIYEDTTLKTLTTDYTVSGAGNSAGGSATFTTAPANGVIVTLKRQLAIKRTSDFQESGEFRSKVINDELDFLTASLQQVEDDLGRSLRLSATDAANSLELPAKAARVSKFLAFDNNGDPVASDASGAQGPQGPAGNMDGANNLSELTNVATARTNLELGSAAVESVAAGGAGDLLRDDGDGSGLTGIVAGATDAEKANIILNAFRIAVVGGLSVQNMIDGVVDEFEDETGVDTGTSTNEIYDAAGDYYNNPEVIGTDLIPDMTSNTAPSGIAEGNDELTGAWQAFNKDTGDAWVSDVVGPWWITYQFAASQTIRRYTIYGGSTGTAPEDWTFEGWNGSGWDILDTRSGQDTEFFRATFDVASPGSFLKYRLNITAVKSHPSQCVIHEWEMIDVTPVADMTLVSNAVTALAQPDDAFIVLWQEDVDAITLNTDLKAFASRDGGATWDEITLTEGSILSTGRILSGSVALTSSGTSMKYKIETLNTKEQRIHAVGLEWS